MKSLFLPISILHGIAAGIFGAEVTIQLPPETATLKPAKGVEIAQANCLTCHSVDYLLYQPPMPRKFWEAEAKKMQAKYGAPIADDKLAALVDYLTAAYGAAEPAKR